MELPFNGRVTAKLSPVKSDDHRMFYFLSDDNLSLTCSSGWVPASATIGR
jgi:hypothetical protein